MKKNSETIAPIRVTDITIAQGPAGRFQDPDDREWEDGNGY